MQLAEPLFALVSEMFQLRGLLRCLRRSLVSLVQLRCGTSLGRQLARAAAWLSSPALAEAGLPVLRDALLDDRGMQLRSNICVFHSTITKYFLLISPHLFDHRRYLPSTVSGPRPALSSGGWRSARRGRPLSGRSALCVVCVQ